MISQVIYTIIMALGVASGTKATSNTFYDAEKPQQKRAVEQYNVNINYANVAEWHNEGYVKEYKKYYLNDTGNNTITPTYILDNMIIYNSVYTFETPYPGNNTIYRMETIGIYKIQNIYNGIAQFKMDELLNMQNNLNYAINFNYTSTDTILDTAIDCTLTEGSFTTIRGIIDNADKTLINNENINTGNTNYEYIINETPVLTLQQNEIIYVIMQISADMPYNNENNAADIILYYLNIDATYQAPNYTYEIVDIPGVMFSVISMPFSFISTAFNLTIFPNTPYQVNFANLFMVILAAFILMWLIKKVFH